jgi:co-chaperonin GroES (HSP10)
MNLASFQPRQAFVLVRKLKFEQAGGIIVPGNEYGKFALAEVVAVGPGNACVSGPEYMADTEDLIEGMKIIMETGKAGGLSGRQAVDYTLPFTVNGEKLLMINQSAIAAIVTLGDPDNDND